MDWNFIIKNIPVYIHATYLTLLLAIGGILLSLIIGFLCSSILYFKVKGARVIVKLYIELSRNTPLLIQLFFLYYGLTKLGVKISGFACGIIGLAFLGGSYMAESFRGGLESVSKAQLEAGISVGLSKMQVFKYIILPQAFSVSVPSIGANCLFLLKETSIVGAIAVADLMFVAKDLIGMYYKTSEALFMLVVAYLIILLPISILTTVLERRSRYAQYGL
ncbi:amino acid ABC transporter permease [Clostridium uliginosum]|uniref:Polar amino acid transport system permease protein n=1 Tax=Clostridium uliginosum TaxID=119641 RepID=A0A1I1H4W8_9CLOT|nr:amino acid ABC transporter permease [Clostridium uliginosum]SFC19209.1 polar amino acid transport system permease protein [Clostridium uliginosum]